MPIGHVHLLDVTIDDAPTSAAAAYNLAGIVPRWMTLLVTVTESGSGSTVTLTVEVSPDSGKTLITYDKLLTDAGTDGPVASIVYSATGDDVVSLSPEDVVDYINVTMTGGNTTGANYYAVDVWLSFAY